MLGPLTYLDLALLAVAFISGLLAMYRGFTRELLSILSWAVAAGAVLYFVVNHKKFAEEMAQQMGVQTPIAQIAIGSVIFLIVLIVVHLITARVSDAILDSRVGMVDRTAGFMFGVLRGFILIVIPYMFYESFFPEPKTALSLGARCEVAALYQGHRQHDPAGAAALHAIVPDGSGTGRRAPGICVSFTRTRCSGGKPAGVSYKRHMADGAGRQ